MNLPFGRGTERPDVRLEAGLSDWLRTLEPAGTPIALRLRVSADLRNAADGPRRPLPWLLPALSSLVSTAATVAGIGLILFVALAGANVTSSVGGPGAVSPSAAGGLPGLASETGFGGLGPVGMLMLVILSVAAGAPLMLRPVRLMLRPVRRAASRVVFGEGQVPPSALRPLRRPLSEISPVTWALGVVAVAAAVWLYGVERPDGTLNTLIYYGNAIVLPFAFVVTLRYQRRDRSGMLLLLGSLALSLALPLSLAINTVRPGPDPLAGWPISVALISLRGGGLVALGVGVLARSGPSERPRPILAALAVGVTTFMVLLSIFQSNPDLGSPWPWVVLEVVGLFWSSLSVLVWFGLLWIGLATVWRRPRHWGWWLVTASGALAVLTVAGLEAKYFWDFNVPLEWWQLYTQYLALTLLLLALLVGLWPVPLSGVPHATLGTDPLADHNLDEAIDE
jgi:hypothetical protein